MSTESVMPSNQLALGHPLLLPSSIFPSIRVFSNESALPIRWPKYWHFSFSISPSSEYSGLISFQIDWFDLLAVQGTLKNLVQCHSSKASILWHSAVFMVQLSHPYMTTRKMCSQGYGLPSSPYEETVFSPLCSLASFVIDYLTYKCVGLFLGSTFCSIDLYICFYASTIL